ncbi:radical SAM family heme chaperone HemW [Granulicella sp. WH15]|uniref:radical SAM family heme chaperone HemW n=1 Tax=Granulicella sp. WH15 TaxID=2602070 RepID=UPI001367932E|nr:radical SAM family heme chaperone HemW [Granulicella sp. WH15]QHN04225.1 radical SAM family heme chaperone HemW [Granulicella sp. WH15]
MRESTGVYISIPFCKAKCSFCNFASGVFAADRIAGYVDRLCAEIAGARASAARLGAELPEHVDTVYFGGGTPSLLEPRVVERIFAALRGEFTVAADAEITVECAPGQLEEATLEQYQREGMNRVSFGVQSFIDRESASVGRLHTGVECLAEMERMRRAGVGQRSLDLIVGLPHQTVASWRYSVDEALASGAEHVSVYMLEVDEDSRLGRELLASGDRYRAGAVPDEDSCADWYAEAVGWLGDGGVAQYEISNFARTGCRSRHNIKYWQRKPYIGFGLDAHSMLRSATDPMGAVRWANPDEMEGYLGLGDGLAARALPGVIVDRIGRREAFEETLFLGLRMNSGVELERLRADFGALVDEISPSLAEVQEAGLLTQEDGCLRLTSAGRMVSNEVFGRLLLEPVA